MVTELYAHSGLAGELILSAAGYLASHESGPFYDNVEECVLHKHDNGSECAAKRLEVES